MLLLTQHLHATDPRDKIFAFHGLLKALGAKLPAPDYTKPVQQVYREAAAVAIRHDNSLHILSSITGENSLKGLPSWVPDWSNSLPITEIARWDDHDMTKHVWPGYLFHISDDAKALTLRGREVDTIKMVSLAFPHRFLEAGSNKMFHKSREIDALQKWLNTFENNTLETSMVRFFSSLTEEAWERTKSHPNMNSNTLSKYWIKGVKRTKTGKYLDWIILDSLRREAVECARKDFAAWRDIQRDIIRFHELVRTLLDRKIMFTTASGHIVIELRWDPLMNSNTESQTEQAVVEVGDILVVINVQYEAKTEFLETIKGHGYISLNHNNV
ncbi:hypothetical protein N0V90_007024 [Kalmusia sp. IMI 367209]|nr:hypothetical protein N0V90_007024 [Kalmusia sp. IMI 367209]